MQAAVEVRKQVNQLDNLTTSKAVDALLNAETVALFGNRQLEVRVCVYACVCVEHWRLIGACMHCVLAVCRLLRQVYVA